MRKSKVKTMPNSEPVHPATWDDVVRDAVEEIAFAKQRIARLEGIVRTCERMKATGEPFPQPVLGQKAG